MTRTTLLTLKDIPKAYVRQRRNVDLPSGSRTTYQMEKIYWDVVDRMCIEREWTIGELVVDSIERFPSSSVTSSMRIAALCYVMGKDSDG